MPGHIADTFRKIALGTVAIAIVLMSAAGAYAIEPFLQGFSAPVGIHAYGDTSLLVSNWSGGTVERVQADGTRSIFLDSIMTPAGFAIDATGRGIRLILFWRHHRGRRAGREAEDGRGCLATPTGIAFARDGRLLIANRSSGEIVAFDKTGNRTVVARGLSLPVGVVEMPDGGIVSSQYGGRVTCILPDGKVQELGQSFNRPGVGILADGDDAVLVIDNGASVVRRVNFDGQSSVVDGLSGSAVALGRAANGDLLVGTWGSGNIYRVAWPKS